MCRGKSVVGSAWSSGILISGARSVC